MPRATAASTFGATLRGLCVGGATGIALSCALALSDPLVAHWVADGPAPMATAVALVGALSSLFAVGAALTGLLFEMSCDGRASGRAR